MISAGCPPQRVFPSCRFSASGSTKVMRPTWCGCRGRPIDAPDVRHVLPICPQRDCHHAATFYLHRNRPYSAELPPTTARIARYAWGDDYHDVLERRLDALLAWMRSATTESFLRHAPMLDTGPVQERVYAQYVRGLGWIGKNSCLINPRARVVAVPRRDHLPARSGRRTRRDSEQCGSFTEGAWRPVRPGALVEPESSIRTGASPTSTIEAPCGLYRSSTSNRSAHTSTAVTSVRKSVRITPPGKIRSRPIRIGSRGPVSTCRGWPTSPRAKTVTSKRCCGDRR